MSTTRHLSDDQIALRDLAASLFSSASTAHEGTSPEGIGERERLWGEAIKCDLVTLLAPAPIGSDLTVTELCLVLEQQAVHLVELPLWTSALGLGLLARQPAHEALLGEIATSITDTGAWLTLADEQLDGQPVLDAAPIVATTDAGPVLTGTRAAVAFADGARWILVVSATDDEPALFLVDTAALTADQLRIESVATTALSERALVHFDRAPATLVAQGDDVSWLLARRDLCLSALHLGYAREALRLSGEYVNERHQFGRPIGTFQAISQQIADCQIEVSAIDVGLRSALTELDAGDDARAAVLAARWLAGDLGVTVCQRAVRFHGGYGVDLESRIHRYLVLSLDLSIVGGDPDQHLERLGDLLMTEEREYFEGN